MRHSGPKSVLLSVIFGVAVGVAAGVAASASAQAVEVAYATAPQSAYVVFFHQGGDKLSPTAMKTVSMAASKAKSASIVRLTGSADRTTIVKAELVKLGIPANSIQIRPDTRQSLPTAADAVSDPVSRGVKIDF